MTSAVPTPAEWRQRSHNERLILDLVRSAKALSRAEIARAAPFSAQSAGVIVGRLAEQGLLSAGQTVRGRVGQPSTPFRLNPIGAASLGFKIGRRSADILVMGLDYSVMARTTLPYDVPDANALPAQIVHAAKDLIADLPASARDGLLGAGLAMPNDLWRWPSPFGGSNAALAAWQDADLRGHLERALCMPVAQINDGSAAGLAALHLEEAAVPATFLHVFVGTFVGGGLALNGRIFEGAGGNAAALGSLPTGLAVSDGPAGQVLDLASLHALDAQARREGVPPAQFYDGHLTARGAQIMANWLEEAAPALAFACLAGQAVLDAGVLILDTELAPSLRAQLVEAVIAASVRYDDRGLGTVTFVQGTLGPDARALGSALLPFQHCLAPAI